MVERSYAEPRLSEPRLAEPSARGGRGPADDPLAELARLIGDDVFADRGAPRPAAAAPAPQPALRGSVDPFEDMFADLDRSRIRPPAAPVVAPAPAGARFDDFDLPPRALPETRTADPGSRRRFADDPVDLPDLVPGPAAGRSAYDDRDDGAPAYAAQGGATEGYGGQGYAPDSYPTDGYAPTPLPLDDIDPPTERRARGGLITVAAVLGLAVIGAAGAFGYRMVTGGATQTAEAPLITPPAQPPKVTAAPLAPATTEPPKPQDRVGGERVASREEQPVDPARSAPRGAGSDPAASPDQPIRVRTTTIRQDPALSGIPPQQGAPAAAPIPAVPAVPVQTTTIPGQNGLPAPVPPAPQTTPRVVGATPVTPPPRGADPAPPIAPRPVQTTPVTAAPPAPPAVAAVPPRPAAPQVSPSGNPSAGPPPVVPATPRAAVPSAGGVSPAGNPSAGPPPVVAAPPRVAAAPPAVAPPTPPRPAPPVAAAPAPPPPAVVAAPPPAAAAAPAAGAGSGFYVQVTAQRSETEAQSELRRLRGQYPLLGQQASVVRRVQLPSGVWYRGGVGPFGSRDDANNFCQSLQGSGQACIVQRN